MTEMMDIEVNNVTPLLDAVLSISEGFGGIKPWWRGQPVLENLAADLRERGFLKDA